MKKRIIVRRILLGVIFIMVVVFVVIHYDSKEYSVNNDQVYINRICEMTGISSMSVAIIDKDAEIFLNYSRDDDMVINEKSLYELASTTKAFTALGILQLEKEGRLKLTDSVNQYVAWFEPEFEGKRATITIGQLLEHTSGIPTWTICLIPSGTSDNSSLHQTVEKIKSIRLDNEPGMVHEYATIPVYRANMGGTIYFDVQEYHPYVAEKFFAECESYIIYSVEPVHSAIAKRYSVQVILKQPMFFSEIAVINHEIVQTVKHLKIYENKKQEEKWKNKSANFVFCYFGLDETDIINSNYLCHTTWADETQDKNQWYPLYKNCEVIVETRVIITRMVTLAEQIISSYNEYLNGTKGESDFKDDMARITPELSKLYFAETDLDISPNDLKEWSQLCSNLAGTIHDFSLYYGQNAFSKRTPENRKACMDMSIRRYYKDLQKLRAIDSSL